MTNQADQSGVRSESGAQAPPAEKRNRKGQAAMLPVRLQEFNGKEQSPHRQAELFYLQKQIQSQTPMVIVLDDGERIEGCIEWFDRDALKVRGRGKTLIYKSAIKYMYKLGEGGR
jgi:sRNA-binding regulator protein Hfq